MSSGSLPPNPLKCIVKESIVLNAISILIIIFVELRYSYLYSSSPVPKMNEHQNVNKEYKAPQRIT